MEVEPLQTYSSLIFKLPIGYISYGKIYVDIINIDDSNDLFEFYDDKNIESSIKIPHNLYYSVSDIFIIIIEELKNKYNIEATFVDQKFTILTENIYIKYNTFTDFIQLNQVDKYFNNNEYYVNTLKMNQPNEFYAILSTSTSNFISDSSNAYKTFTLSEGYNNIIINFQNEYNGLYLIISSNANKYPLKYNKLSKLYVNV